MVLKHSFHPQLKYSLDQEQYLMGDNLQFDNNTKKLEIFKLTILIIVNNEYRLGI